MRSLETDSVSNRLNFQLFELAVPTSDNVVVLECADFSTSMGVPEDTGNRLAVEASERDITALTAQTNRRRISEYVQTAYKNYFARLTQ